MPLIPQMFWQNFSDSSWKSYHFTKQKAVIACLFAKLAYKNIPIFEVPDAERSFLIPSFDYMDAVKNNSIPNLQEVLRELDLGEDYFVIEGQYTVILGLRVRGIIFISIRGSRWAFNDWGRNLSAPKVPLYNWGYPAIKAHRGFKAACDNDYEKVLQEIANRNWSNSPMDYCLTGHSLGGAVCSLMKVRGAKDPSGAIFGGAHCYTFGAPRMLSSHQLGLAGVFDIERPRDPVPRGPPKLFGYHKLGDQLLLAPDGNYRPSLADRLSILQLWRLKRAIGHEIEYYIEELIKVPKRSP